MFLAQVDKSQRLLKISFAQRVGPEEMKRCFEKIQTLLADMQPGFRLLTNLRSLESMDIACAPYIKQIMDLCNQKGVKKVVRVIPDPKKDIGLSIMSLFHYRRDVHIVTCKNLKEATKILSP